METPSNQGNERARFSPVLFISPKIRALYTRPQQELAARLTPLLGLVQVPSDLSNKLVAPVNQKLEPLLLKLKPWQKFVPDLPGFFGPTTAAAPLTVSTEDRVLVVMGASCACPRCGGGPLLFEKAALARETNICPICTRTIEAKNYRPKLLECAYIVMEELCEKCGLPRYAESLVDWVRVSPVCSCDQSSVRVNSTRYHHRIRAALRELSVSVPENMPARGTRKVVCPFSGNWHKDAATFYYKTGRIICWNCRKMTSLVNLVEPESDEARQIAEQLRQVSNIFWEPLKPVKESGRKGNPPAAVTIQEPPPEIPRLTRRELIDQWFSDKGYIPQKMAARYQQWLYHENRLTLPVRPIPNWPAPIDGASLQRATHLERPGTTVHFIKGAGVSENYTQARQLISHQESFWEDDSRHLVADSKVMDSVAANWEQQVYSFIEHNDHLLTQWSRAHGRNFCAYLQIEAIDGITEYAWKTGTKTPDFVVLSVSNNNKLLVSICDVKLSARAWSAEHDLQLSPENFRALLNNYPPLINQLLDAVYYAAPKLKIQGREVEWPRNVEEFLQWLDQDRIQIQVGFRAIPDLPSRRRALLVTREKALHLNGNGNGRNDEQPIPDRPYLLLPCCLAGLYRYEPGAHLVEELVNFDGLARLRGQIGTWERLWLYEKYSRRGLALSQYLRRRGWDTSTPARLRHSLYECSAQLGVTSTSQYLAQLCAPAYHRAVSNLW